MEAVCAGESCLPEMLEYFMLCKLSKKKKKVDVLDKIPQALSVSVRFKCVFY